jgi:2-dehydropantoate 2-reductase
MKICIYGAGAIGGHIAARLLRADLAQVSLVARGAHLAAIQDKGLTLQEPDHAFTVALPPGRATDDSRSLPPQDLVIVTLKTGAQAAAAQALNRLLAPQGAVLFINNGIPWWWSHGLPGAQAGSLPLLDPRGDLWRELGPQRVLGGVVYSPNEVAAPGVIAHRSPLNRYLLGEPAGGASARLREIAELFTASGLPAELPSDVRRAVWRKLLLNASANTLSALTQLPNGMRADDAGLRAVAAGIVNEVLDVAAHAGWDLRDEIDVAALVADASKPDARPSMLQDVMLRRPLEVEALLGQPQAFARAAGLATPYIDVVLPLLRGLNRGLTLNLN